MPKALFLDRDGVINIDHNYVADVARWEWVDGIFVLCSAAQAKGYLLVVVTNQGGIGRGLYTQAGYDALTAWMLAEFAQRGIVIAKVYHCPHHPEHGVGAYKKECEDRKPGPGMILKAAKEFSIDLAQSVLIGDKETDIGAGKNAGVGRCVRLGADTADTQADAVVATLAEMLAFL